MTSRARSSDFCPPRMPPPGTGVRGGGRGPAGRRSRSSAGFDSSLLGAELINAALTDARNLCLPACPALLAELPEPAWGLATGCWAGEGGGKLCSGGWRREGLPQRHYLAVSWQRGWQDSPKISFGLDPAQVQLGLWVPTLREPVSGRGVVITASPGKQARSGLRAVGAGAVLTARW